MLAFLDSDTVHRVMELRVEKFQVVDELLTTYHIRFYRLLMSVKEAHYFNFNLLCQHISKVLFICDIFHKG